MDLFHKAMAKEIPFCGIECCGPQKSGMQRAKRTARRRMHMAVYLYDGADVRINNAEIEYIGEMMDLDHQSLIEQAYEEQWTQEELDQRVDEIYSRYTLCL